MFDEQRSVQKGPNAVLLPVSDNTTGKVYVAVVALPNITVASGEDVCIDYGLPYWRSRRSLARMLQVNWVLTGLSGHQQCCPECLKVACAPYVGTD
jgi:hypothetical protein